jgi:hypothetical protein
MFFDQTKKQSMRLRWKAFVYPDESMQDTLYEILNYDVASYALIKMGYQEGMKILMGYSGDPEYISIMREIGILAENPNQSMQDIDHFIQYVDDILEFCALGYGYRGDRMGVCIAGWSALQHCTGGWFARHKLKIRKREDNIRGYMKEMGYNRTLIREEIKFHRHHLPISDIQRVKRKGFRALQPVHTQSRQQKKVGLKGAIVSIGLGMYIGNRIFNKKD